LFLPSYSPDFRVADRCPANVLLEASQEEWPSLVVVGSWSLAGIIRTRLGSVSTLVVTASPGPVPVYRT
jgi:Universal stress protein family